MLADEGMNVTLNQASEILSFLRFMAERTVKKFLKDSESGEIVEEDVLPEKYETPNKNKQKQKVSTEGKIYCSTCNFLNNNF
ncbi:hypothetical protein EV144_10498 [Flavobacterium sp. 270]|uniref:hypothetical protein n=1 Tax=Flavobacterium sp. 270 TaxID=2512114 RepID=UPI00106547C2|nr:hypothetical protein [Flavobacterium sp. 270]TDW47812.1 hypothetical protein EV144_10498 [Flavobacterium sp. 270]